MKMEKKTLTSLAMITFLMTSTAVIAMANEDSSHLGSTTVKIVAADKDNQPPVAPKTASGQSNGHWLWGWFSSSTAPVEQENKSAAHTLEDPSHEDSSASAATLKTAIQLDTSLNMEEFNPYLTSGFSAFEGTHKWTDGDKAIITLPLEGMEPRPTSISFLNTGSFVTPSHPQKLILRMNGVKLDEYDYTHVNNNQRINITLPKDDATAIIEFETPNAIIPSALGLNNPDKRKLGIAFKEVQFQISTPSAIPTEDDFIMGSVNLDPERFQQLLQLAKSPNAGKLEKVQDIFSSSSSLTVPSGTPPQTLNIEERGWLSALYHGIFG